MNTQPDLTKSQLFLDDTWVADQQRLQRRWYPAEVYPEPLLRPDMPWEGTDLIFYGTAFRIDGVYRLYYSTFNPGQPSLTCVAESEDGLRWHRPVVGTVEYRGSRDNNIVMSGIVHPSVMHEPDDPAAPFKLIWQKGGAIRGATSRDGYRWTPLPDPLLTPVGDVQNILFHKVNGQYVLLLKPHHGRQRYGARSVGVTRSPDFRCFPPFDTLLKPDLVDGPEVEYYGMTAFPYADLYLGLLWRYNGIPDFIDIVLGWSHDLRQWHWPVPRAAFIGPTYYWNQGWSSSSSAPPIPVGNQLRFYFGGRTGAHTHVKQGPIQYGVVGMATITEDRFVSLSAGVQDGKLLTKPLTWPGGDLLLNASTTRHLDGYPLDGGGALFVEALDESGQPIAGFAGPDRAEFVGNVPSRHLIGPASLRWPGERRLAELTGQRIRLAFTLRDAHLFSFRASP